MKKNRWVLIFGLMIMANFYCSKKDNSTNPSDTPTGSNIQINATVDNPSGLDSLLVATDQTWQLQAATLVPQNPPNYEWSVGDTSIFQLTSDSAMATIKAVGDSGAATTITVKDLANNQQKVLKVKVAVWADLDRFTYVGSLNSHHYFVSKLSADLAPAEVFCEDSHGHLVTITSKEENEVVKKGRDKVGEDVWIGLFWMKVKLWTEWINGEKVTYSNWKSSYPNYVPNDYDNNILVYMDANGKWVNARSMAKFYVLEIP